MSILLPLCARLSYTASEQGFELININLYRARQTTLRYSCMVPATDLMETTLECGAMLAKFSILI